ncbi:hypothetical protein NL676_035243 [Syzygium grande]|nr:hypothetical protein NL676_035243 [Syzygium grande]
MERAEKVRSRSREISEVEGPSVGDSCISAAAEYRPIHCVISAAAKYRPIHSVSCDRVEKEVGMAAAGTTSASDDHRVFSIGKNFKRLSPPSDCCIVTVPEKLPRTNKEEIVFSKDEKEMRMAGAGTTSASDDHLNELVISIQSRFVGLSPPSDCCIFIVPEKLRRTNKEAYTPRVVAIGPYHRCKLEDYIERVKSWENEARNCYDKEIDLNSNQFAEMMVLDGIFVIQLFLTDWRCHGDRIFNMPWMFDDVMRDMALLENQLPFLSSSGCSKWRLECTRSTRRGFLNSRRVLQAGYEDGEVAGGGDGIGDQVPSECDTTGGGRVKHFVDVIGLSFFPSVGKAPNKRNEKIKFPPSVTQLVAAGVKLRRGESECLFDIEFENGVLEIPCLLINNFAKEILLSENYHFSSLSDELINHCQRTYNTWKATLKRDYCSNPWVVSSVIAAVVLLLLTIVQTLCSVFSLI